MKTKEQKSEQIDQTARDLEGSKTLIVADFTGTSVNDLNSFRGSLREVGAFMRVVKKRLLKIVFSNKEVGIDPGSFEGQTGVVFSDKDIVETSQVVYKFAKEHGATFKILGGAELTKKKVLSGEEVRAIGKLPSRDILIGQLVGMIASPIRSFLFVLKERSKMVG